MKYNKQNNKPYTPTYTAPKAGQWLVTHNSKTIQRTPQTDIVDDLHAWILQHTQDYVIYAVQIT